MADGGLVRLGSQQKVKGKGMNRKAILDKGTFWSTLGVLITWIILQLPSV